MADVRVLLLVLAAAALVTSTADGATYTVGAPAGSWDLRTNYTAWASSSRFQAGDQLRFQYPVAVHDVVEVGKAGYDACNGSSPVATFPTGADVVPLAAAATRYFICGVPGHCAAGMKLQVVVKARPQPPLQCRGRGSRRRCNWPAPTSASSAARGESMVALWSAAAVAAVAVLFF